MSNILIIKHGSLGDIAQASGAIQDISDNHPNDDRAKIKLEINNHTGSVIKEIKEYTSY